MPLVSVQHGVDLYHCMNAYRAVRGVSPCAVVKVRVMLWLAPNVWRLPNKHNYRALRISPLPVGRWGRDTSDPGCGGEWSVQRTTSTFRRDPGCTRGARPPPIFGVAQVQQEEKKKTAQPEETLKPFPHLALCSCPSTHIHTLSI